MLFSILFHVSKYRENKIRLFLGLRFFPLLLVESVVEAAQFRGKDGEEVYLQEVYLLRLLAAE